MIARFFSALWALAIIQVAFAFITWDQQWAYTLGDRDVTERVGLVLLFVYIYRTLRGSDFIYSIIKKATR